MDETRADARRLALAGALLALLLGGLLIGGCGGDDDDGGDTDAGTATTGISGPSDGSSSLADVEAELRSVGYTVDSAEPEALIRRDDGGIVQPDGKIEVSGNDIAGESVSVYSLASPEDIEAMQAFSDGQLSVARGAFYFQGTEGADALRVADSSGVTEEGE